MHKIMLIFGTRPEAIKMAPVVKKLQENGNSFKLLIIVTAQHRDMLDQVLRIFNIKSDYDLNIMKENQSIEEVTVNSLIRLSEIIRFEKPEMILVQGDTTTTFVGALAGFYNKVPVGHVEAGLRTYDKFQPFPEEMNRRLTTTVADIHFAPTMTSAENLIKEGVSPKQIHVTGNTVIDALLEVVNRRYSFEEPLNKIIDNNNKRLILLTAHRRENFGNPLKNICLSVKKITDEFDDVEVLFPVHPNPHVWKTVSESLKNERRIHLISPLDYEAFSHVMNKCYLILTDSGGIQEEAPSLGKPVLVLRNKTERPEAVKAGTVKLVGTETEKIVKESFRLLQDRKEYNKMAQTINPYGDGMAAERIFKIIHSRFI